MLDLVHVKNAVVMQYGIIYKVSFLLLVSTMYALYRKQYLLAVFPAIIFLTSLNYWHNPDHDSWQKNLDMCVVSLTTLFWLYKAYGSKYMGYAYGFMSMGIIFYLLGWYFYYMRMYMYCTYSHCAFHLCGNSAFCVLASGNIL